ncbi:MAG: YtxH domain-containing protein [Nitrospira sp.]|nr:YtxH domain-containing protein [Nitrospira sp.]
MEREWANERLRHDDGVDAIGMGAILAAFGLGLLAGTVATLLTTPESGSSVRNRLRRGVETAKKEMDEVVGEATQDWATVSGDVSDAVKRTASRVKKATEVTKGAMTSGDEPVRRVP